MTNELQVGTFVDCVTISVKSARLILDMMAELDTCNNLTPEEQEAQADLFNVFNTYLEMSADEQGI
mgnify:CR=1 FL=1